VAHNVGELGGEVSVGVRRRRDRAERIAVAPGQPGGQVRTGTLEQGSDRGPSLGCPAAQALGARVDVRGVAAGPVQVVGGGPRGRWVRLAGDQHEQGRPVLERGEGELVGCDLLAGDPRQRGCAQRLQGHRLVRVRRLEPIRLRQQGLQVRDDLLTAGHRDIGQLGVVGGEAEHAGLEGVVAQQACVHVVGERVDRTGGCRHPASVGVPTSRR
jgi:hypothetical protein